MFKKLRGLLQADTSDAIAAALAEIDLNTLRGELAAAEARRKQLLLEGNDKQVLEAEAAVTAARLNLDRAAAATEALEAKLAEAKAREFDEEFERDRAAVVAKCNEVAQELRKIGPAAAEIERIAKLVHEAHDARYRLYRVIAEDMAGQTAAGRSAPVPSPVDEWTVSGVPEWAIAMIKRADQW